MNAQNSLADYQIVREAGRGAMSTVYEAVDARDGRTVALKVLSIPAALSPLQQQSLIARLAREARLVARLSHPNIVRILDIGAQDGRHFLAMEYLRGTTLRQRLDRGPLTLPEASRILDQIASALDAIHAQRIVHRDIKPSNVMLLPDGTVKLMDFGVARQGDDTTITQTGMIVGSPAYMAPEQIRGEGGEASSDLWALGVLLYEMLAGRSPWAGPNIPAVLYKVTHDPPEPIVSQPPPVQHLLRRAMEKKPARRYHTAREMADALRAVWQPTTAPPMRPHRWQRAILPVAGLLGVLIVAGGAKHFSFRRASPTPPSPILTTNSVAATLPVSIVERPVPLPRAKAKPGRIPPSAKPVKAVLRKSGPRRRSPAFRHVRRGRRTIPIRRTRRLPQDRTQQLEHFIYNY